MKLGFEETQTPYDSGSQQARAWTERWVADTMFCPNCGNPRLSQLPANRPVADFFCPQCHDQYEVKSKKRGFGTVVADGAYATKIERLSSKTNPNLMLLSYDRSNRVVSSVFVVPKHFFVPEIVQKRPPLREPAR